MMGFDELLTPSNGGFEIKGPVPLRRLCSLAAITPQLFNKYQRYGLVRTPRDRRRGKRQSYRPWDVEHAMWARFLSRFFPIRVVARIKRLEGALVRCASLSPARHRRRRALRIDPFFYPRPILFQNPETEPPGRRAMELLAPYLQYRYDLRSRVAPLARSDFVGRATEPLIMDLTQT